MMMMMVVVVLISDVFGTARCRLIRGRCMPPPKPHVGPSRMFSPGALYVLLDVKQQSRGPECRRFGPWGQ